MPHKSSWEFGTTWELLYFDLLSIYLHSIEAREVALSHKKRLETAS